MYGYELLDPRPIPAAATANDRVFGFGVPVYGIEVTVPALAARCVYNLDPQHTGGDANLAAIEAALTEELPPMGTILATIRADLDAVGAMAIIVLREQDFVLFFNKSISITPKLHMLHLLPGIGKKLMWEILEERRALMLAELRQRIVPKLKHPTPETVKV